MSKTVKKLLSMLLCTALLFGVAPLDGFVGMHFPQLDLPKLSSLFSSVAHAADPTSGACGTNLTWVYDSDAKTLTISGTGAMSNYNSSPYNGSPATTAPWRPYINTMQTLVINSGVKSIGNYAFYGCTGLTSVTIPNSVTSIGEWAFFDCTRLTSVTIPDSVKSIEYSAFCDCAGLTSIMVSPDNPTYHSAGNCLIKTESKFLILGCKTSVIPTDGSVRYIGYYAFRGCTGLTSITIPDSVICICDCAFYGCTSLTSITIPDSVTDIDYAAFKGCTGLTSITIPDSVKYIGEFAFELVANVFYHGSASGSPWGAKAVNGYVEAPFIYADSTKTTLQACLSSCSGEITIPNSVTSIGSSAFEYCTSLTSVTIPNSVTSIGKFAFNLVANVFYHGSASGSPWGARAVNGYVEEPLVYADSTKTTLLACPSSCSGEITIPNNVTSIGKHAFFSCTGLTSVTIPDSVNKIYDSVFYGCTSLTYVYYLGSEEQWSKISIGSNNNPLQNAIIHYNSTGFGDDPISEEYGLNIIINNQTLAYRTNEIIIIGVSYYQDDKESVPDDIQVKVSDSKVLSVSSIFDLDDIPLDALKIFVPEVIETYNQYKFIMLNAKEAGSSSVTISCSNNEMITRTIPFVISEDKVATLRATEVTTHEYSLLGERDYYNSFHNGIWVSDFSYKSATNEAGEKGWKFSMNIYNENYSCGVVEVYDADGKIYDIKEIKKFETLGKSLYKTLKSGFTLIQDIAEGDVLSFRSDTTAKHTPINDLFVPQDGYLVVTSSCITSVHCAVINAVDMLFTAWKLAKDTKEIVTGIDNLDTDAVEQIKLKMIAKLLCSEEYLNAGKKLQKKFVEKGLQNLTVDGINAIAGGLTTDVDTFLKDMGLSLDSLLKLSFNAGVGIAEDVLERCMQGYGLLLKGMFAFVDYTDFLSQAHDVTKCCTKDAQFGCYTPNPNYPKGIISNEDVKVKTNNNVPTSSVLESYRIYNADRVDFYVSNIDTSNDYEMYEISLRNNGELVQPSGDVTVSIVCPYKKAVVVRLNSDGSWKLLDSTIDKGVITFNVDHFCRFAIISKDNDTPPAQPKIRSVSLGDVTINYKAKTTLKPQITADEGAKYTVSYSSSNANVVKVNEKTGEVTGAKKGTATITCTVTDSYGNTVSDTCKVTVKYTVWQWIIIILLFGWIWYK